MYFEKTKDFRGKFISSNWKDGLRRETMRVVNHSGLGLFSYMYDMYLNNGFAYQGSKSVKSVEKYISERLTQLEPNQGEIIRVGKPIGSITYNVELHMDCPQPFGITCETLKIVALSQKNNLYSDGPRHHYTLLEVRPKGANYIIESSSLSVLKNFAFSLMNPFADDTPKNIQYYIRDNHSGKYHECYINRVENRKEYHCAKNEGEIVIPMYEFVYFGRA